MILEHDNATLPGGPLGIRRGAQSGHVYQLRVSNISLSTRHPTVALHFFHIAPSPFSLSTRLDIPALISLRLPCLSAAFLCLSSLCSLLFCGPQEVP